MHDIEDWVEGRKTQHARVTTGDETKSQAQARLSAARASLAELALRKELGELIDAGDVLSRWLRVQNEARAQLAQLPALILKALPAACDTKARRKTRAQVQRLVDQCLEALASFAEAEAAEAEAAAQPQEPDGSADET